MWIAVAVQVKESLWDQKGQGAFHIKCGFYPENGEHQCFIIAAPGGFLFTLNCSIWSPNV